MDPQGLFGQIDWWLVLIGGVLPIAGPVLLTYCVLWVAWQAAGDGNLRDWTEWADIINPSGWLFFCAAGAAFSLYILIFDSPIEDQSLNSLLIAIAIILGVFASPMILAVLIVLKKVGEAKEDHPKKGLRWLTLILAISVAFLRLTLIHLERVS